MIGLCSLQPPYIEALTISSLFFAHLAHWPRVQLPTVSFASATTHYPGLQSCRVAVLLPSYLARRDNKNLMRVFGSDNNWLPVNYRWRLKKTLAPNFHEFILCINGSLSNWQIIPFCLLLDGSHYLDLRHSSCSNMGRKLSRCVPYWCVLNRFG